MTDLPACPKCKMENTYPDGELIICPDCGHEWPAAAPAAATDDSDVLIVKDANGNLLADGDTVIIAKDLKVKGSSMVLKGGTKIKGIRLVAGDHDVDCKINGTSMLLKAIYLKKA